MAVRYPKYRLLVIFRVFWTKRDLGQNYTPNLDKMKAELAKTHHMVIVEIAKRNVLILHKLRQNPNKFRGTRPLRDHVFI